MGEHIEALERLFNNPLPRAARERRLDAELLKVSAQAAGFRDEAHALRSALDTTSTATAALQGVVPGSLARWRVALALGVSEYRLWPVAEIGSAPPAKAGP